MSIKDDELYPLYISYLENKKMSNGAFKLALISSDMFGQFCFRYESNPIFRDNQDKIFLSEKRNEVLNDILDDDFEIFLDGLEVRSEEKDEFFYF